MKRYLIKLNQPVIVDNSTCKEKKQTTIYGFLGPVIEDDNEPNDYLVYDIVFYVDYLAAMDESQRISEIDRNNREETGQTFTLSAIDLDGIEGLCLECGMERSFITCESLMDNLTRLAEQQAGEKKTAQYNVILFNRPIWLPKPALWKEEEGFCHIFGIVVDEEIDRNTLQWCTLYLGYLAMTEEVLLNDVTPSGYTVSIENDDPFWYNRGKQYSCISEELMKESHICRHKHNLRLRGAVVSVPEVEIEKGVKDGLILSQELYEQMRAIIAIADTKVDVRNNPLDKQDRPLFT